jgi:hypothetical protein
VLRNIRTLKNLTQKEGLSGPADFFNFISHHENFILYKHHITIGINDETRTKDPNGKRIVKINRKNKRW